MQTNEKVTLYIENPETPSGKQNITPLLRGMNVLTGEAIDYTMKLTGNKLDETRFIETGSMFNDHFLLLVGSVPVVGEAGQRTTAPVIHTKEGLKEKFPSLVFCSIAPTLLKWIRFCEKSGRFHLSSLRTLKSVLKWLSAGTGLYFSMASSRFRRTKSLTSRSGI